LTQPDLNWQPQASQAARELRAETCFRIREFFRSRGVLEVETPLLSQAANPDPNIDSFACKDETGVPRYLRTSPEFAMKRLLAASSGPIYELGRVFRRAEQGSNHNSEFTLLEWYRPGYDHHRLMDEVESLLQALGACPSGHKASRWRYRDLVNQVVGIDPLTADDTALNQLVNARGWYRGQLTRSACLDLIMSLGVTPGLKNGDLLFVYDFPVCQAALAVIDPDDRRVAQRFEAYLGPVELANGYHELCDPLELAARFEAENQLRVSAGKSPMPLDQRLLAATGEGIEPCAGVALGVDRLLMLLAGAQSLSRILNFPWSRA